MILGRLEEHWDEIAKIGEEAAERGRLLCLKPSWAEEPRKMKIFNHQRERLSSDFIPPKTRAAGIR
jgi:hypothetical protein